MSDLQPIRIAYADPPYPGCSGLYKDHPDFDGEVDHAELVEKIRNYDGWILHTSASALLEVWSLCPEARCAAWVKPFAAWKRNVYPAYTWEPVLFHGGRKVWGTRQTPRDFIAEPITMKRGLTGAKPEKVCHWCFDLLGADPNDQIDDLFPGTGAVMDAWGTYCSTPTLEFPDTPESNQIDLIAPEEIT